ncbi:MAG: glycoside hydrolase domain-containing protein [Armatimonadota bacterium]
MPSTASASRVITSITAAGMLFMPSIMHAYDTSDSKAPLLRIVPMTKAPAIDGVLTPGEWDGAAATNSFHVLGSNNVPLTTQTAWVGYDSQNLYLAVSVALPKGKAPVAVPRERDGAIWQDEGVELFIDPMHDNKTSYQFACNAVGSICDTKDKDAAWNGEWSAKTSVADGNWYLEMAIPLKTVGLNQIDNDTTLGFNVCLNRKSPDRSFTWAPLLEQGGFHQPGKFGHLVLASENGSVSCIQAQSSTEIAFVLQGQPVAVNAMLEVNSQGIKLGEKAFDGVLPARLAINLPEVNSETPDGVYDWNFMVKEPKSGVVLNRVSGSVEVWQHIKLYLRKYFLQGKLGVDAAIPETETTTNATTATVNILDMAGNQLMTQSKPLSGRTTSFLLDISTLPFVECKAVIEVKDDHGKVLITAEQKYIRPALPEWLGSKAGISDKVVAPWTPIKVKQSNGLVSISLWGRSYTFAGSPFPSSVLTNKASILNGPILMHLLVDGKPYILKGRMNITKQTEAQVILDGTASAGSLTASSHVVIDFDGNAFIDVTLNGKQEATIDKFSIEIPIKQRYAKYRHYFPVPYASSENSRLIKESGWEARFVSYLWVGDEERGLALYSNTTENWAWGANSKAAAVWQSNAETVTMAFNMVTAPLKFNVDQLAKGVEYRFGLQATPVKKPEIDTWDYRLTHTTDYHITDTVFNKQALLTYKSPTLLSSPQGTIDMWVKLNFDPNVVFAEGTERGQYNQQLLIISNGQDALYLYWNVLLRGMRVYHLSNGKFTMMGDIPCQWKQNEFHHLSLSWGDAVRVAVDGRQMTDYPFVGLMNGGSAAKTLSLQMSGPGFGLGEVRVSNIIREPSMPKTAYTRDSNTMLLDNLSNITATGPVNYSTQPKVGPKGELTGSVTHSPGPTSTIMSVSGTTMLALDYLKSLGFRTIVMHEQWTDIQNWPEAVGHEQELKTLVKACHDRGLQLLVYFGFEISDIMPHFLDYKDEVMLKDDWQSYSRSPQQKDYVVCYESVWQDFIADGVSKVMDKYDIDGVYLDSTALPFYCKNTIHGCGYVKPDGSIEPTVPFHGTREMMRRLYTIVKSKKPEGQVNLHASGYMLTPATGWATSIWDGEHFSILTDKIPIDELIPLDAYRTEFMGRPQGIPQELLSYDLPFSIHESFAMSLLHDTLVRARGYTLEEEGLVFKAMDVFGKKTAKFKPYWNNAKLVSVKGDKAYCSLYTRQGISAMCVVSSFSKSAQKISVKLNLKAMGLSHASSAVNMMTGETLKLVDGEFILPTAGIDYGLVWVK